MSDPLAYAEGLGTRLPPPHRHHGRTNLPRILQKWHQKLKSHIMPSRSCGPVATLALTSACSAEITIPQDKSLKIFVLANISPSCTPYICLLHIRIHTHTHIIYIIESVDSIIM